MTLTVTRLMPDDDVVTRVRSEAVKNAIRSLRLPSGSLDHLTASELLYVWRWGSPKAIAGLARDFEGCGLVVKFGNHGSIETNWSIDILPVRRQFIRDLFDLGIENLRQVNAAAERGFEGVKRTDKKWKQFCDAIPDLRRRAKRVPGGDECVLDAPELFRALKREPNIA